MVSADSKADEDFSTTDHSATHTSLRKSGNVGNGIYNSEDLTRLRSHIMFSIEKPTLLNTIARGALGETILSGSISLANLLDEDSLERIAESVGKRAWKGIRHIQLCKCWSPNHLYHRTNSQTRDRYHHSCLRTAFNVRLEYVPTGNRMEFRHAPTVTPRRMTKGRNRPKRKSP